MSEKIENNQVENQQDFSELLQIRRDKLANLQQLGKDPFEITICNPDISAAEILDRFEELDGKDVCIAGRIKIGRAHV